MGWRLGKCPAGVWINSVVLCAVWAAGAVGCAWGISRAEMALEVYGLLFLVGLLGGLFVLQLRAGFFRGALAARAAAVVYGAMAAMSGGGGALLVLVWAEAGVAQMALVLVVASAYLAISAALNVRWSRELERPVAGTCPGCGYDLRGSAGRCPECGRGMGGG